MNVPFLDLKAQYVSIKDEIDVAIREVLDSCAFAGGQFVENFEKEWAAYCGVKYAVGVGSGTDALWFAMIALGIGPGDEVITVPNTFIATAEAITFAGATPVFIDVDPTTYTMDPSLLESAITPKTRAIIPVHIFGQMVDMDPLMEFAKNRNLFVIEDACQAHGAEYKGRKAGSIGDVGCFSFYPGKNLGAYGEAGAVITNFSSTAEKIRIFRDHGQRKKYYHDICGWNGRMDGIQGAVLQVKLKHLESWNNARRNVARTYGQVFSATKQVVPPVEASYSKHVYHVYAIRLLNRDALMKAFQEKGVQCGIHYPVPLHQQEAYSSLGLSKGNFPIAEQCAKEFLSLPMYSELREEQIVHVANILKEGLVTLETGERDLLDRKAAS